MAIIPPGFAHFIMPITRSGDPDPYAVTWACEANLAAAAGIQQYCDLVQSNFIGTWETSFPNDCTLGPLTMRLGQDGPDPLVVIASGTDTGTNTADFLPQNIALLIQKRSILGGRRNRGRMFMPVLTEDGVNEVGQLTPTQQASYQGIAADWLEAYNGEDGLGEMVILHTAAPSDPTPVAALVVSGTAATQRRRLRR